MMDSWKLSLEGTSSSLVGSLIISRKAVVDRTERTLNFRKSDRECLAMGRNGKYGRQSHMSF